MSNLIICDIDGVLADCSHRLHYLKERNYEAFYSVANIMEDKLITRGDRMVDMMASSWGSRCLCLLTGRPERTRKITEMWLSYMGVRYTKIYMRKDGDHRPSPEVKVDLIKEMMKENRISDLTLSGYFIDDDPENVKAVCKAFPNITGITFGVGRMK